MQRAIIYILMKAFREPREQLQAAIQSRYINTRYSYQDDPEWRRMKVELEEIDSLIEDVRAGK